MARDLAPSAGIPASRTASDWLCPRSPHALNTTILFALNTVPSLSPPKPTAMVLPRNICTGLPSRSCKASSTVISSSRMQPQAALRRVAPAGDLPSSHTCQNRGSPVSTSATTHDGAGSSSASGMSTHTSHRLRDHGPDYSLENYSLTLTATVLFSCVPTDSYRLIFLYPSLCLSAVAHSGDAVAAIARKQLRGGKLAVATQLVHHKTTVNDPYGSSGAPLWQTATFAQPGATTFGQYDYTRSGNPTRTILEEQVGPMHVLLRCFASSLFFAAPCVGHRALSMH